MKENQEEEGDEEHGEVYVAEEGRTLTKPLWNASNATDYDTFKMNVLLGRKMPIMLSWKKKKSSS